MSLDPGFRIGAYEIVSAIGVGGMGEVYRARDTRLQRDVAVKVLTAGATADADRLMRFEQEARATAALNHPNIVVVYDVGSHEGQPFLVSELLEGQTLRAVLAPGPLPIRKALDYTVQIATGLAAAHDKGIVHRDLKPDNVFITADGRAKILDFGIAKLLASPHDIETRATAAAAHTDAGIVLGTQGYMSPEQIRGGAVDHRADIFALGAILFEMLSGTRPFAAATSADAMSAVLSRDPAELVTPDGTTPPALDRLIRRCLEKAPEQRFQSARDLAFALEAITLGTGRATSRRHTDAVPAPTTTAWRERAAWLLLAAGPRRRGCLPRDPARTRRAATADAGALHAGAPFQKRDCRHRRRERLARWDIDCRAGFAWRSGPREHAAQAIGRRRFHRDPGHCRRPIRDLVSRRPIDRVCRRPGIEKNRSRRHGITAPGADARQPDCQLDCDECGRRLCPGLQWRAVAYLPRERKQRRTVAGARLGEWRSRARRRRLSSRRPPLRLPVGAIGTGLAWCHAPAARSIPARFSDLPEFEDRIMWAGDGHVIFRRGASLLAQAITYAPFALHGAPVPLADDATTSAVVRLSVVSASAGTLAFRTDQPMPQQFTWVGRDGRTIAPIGPPGQYPTFDLSDDGSRLVVSQDDAGAQNIWTIDTAKGTMNRVTVGAVRDVDPRLSPDGRTVIFGSFRDPVRSPYKATISGQEPERLFGFKGRMFALDDWSRNGAWLLYHDSSVPAIQAARFDQPAAEPVTVATGLAGIAGSGTDVARRQMDFVSSGRVRPRRGLRRAVSANRRQVAGLCRRRCAAVVAARRPRALLPCPRRHGDGRAHRARSAAFKAGDPIRLFRSSVKTISIDTEQYAVSPDGKRFLFAPFVDNAPTPSVTVLTNWQSLLTQKAQ